MDGLVREQHYAAEMDGTVLPYLHARRQEGRFTCPTAGSCTMCTTAPTAPAAA